MKALAPVTFKSLNLNISSASPAATASFFSLVSIILVVILIILVAILWKHMKPDTLQKLFKFTKQLPGPDYCSGNLRAINYLDFRTLKRATNNFHPNNQLGSGGFGPVYQGVLDDGTVIAVKQLSLGKSRQGESEFLTEVRMITSIQHKNLVRLVGCCSEGAQRLLVYEYMKNKSLDSILYGSHAIFLNWKIRFQIILGIARGLQYLHEDSNLRIVHRDIKASNILLDDKFQPKIGDFGLARFFPEDQAYLSTTFAGTLGYTAPEYAIRGELSEKADIYSFGVLVLEIISSRKNTDLSLSAEMQYLPEYAWRLYEKSNVIDLVDPKLQADGIFEADVLKTCQVAFLCLQPLPTARPPMSEVVAMLIQKSEGMQSPMRPAFLNRKNQTHRMFSWESLSEQHPSPMRSDSTSFPQATDKSLESESNLPSLLRKFTSFPQTDEKP
ncbi:putative receptor-like protein kinase At4g00960 isoform X2 [Asparagus officinalis]|uniref:putative receptor-like protein kinase At4g00960 isoform X2 n=1 Tax=Asparagus officinalis TaxID=4686 RepID=UPI00098E5FE0|nr:putative receptor-like protein kinase At4g00960 isoform X2 [Asparagus officinalis]